MRLEKTVSPKFNDFVICFAHLSLRVAVDMPGTIGFVPGGPSFFGGNLTRAVNNGSLSIERVDDMCRRIMTPYFYLQQQQASYPQIDGSEPALNGNSRKS